MKFVNEKFKTKYVALGECKFSFSNYILFSCNFINLKIFFSGST